jgi:penicillin-binding protein 2A
VGLKIHFTRLWLYKSTYTFILKGNIIMPMQLSNLRKIRFPKKWWLRLLLIAVICLIVLASVIINWFSGLDISKLAEPIPMPALIYDKNGALASKLASTKINPVTIDHIPMQLKDAVIATEDRRFYDHSGVDIRSIIRALWRDIRSQSFVEGGSTITQQLAKNMFLPTDKSFSRKLKEAAYATKIEMSYSKDEILQLYLNNIYYGDGQWGIQNAAKTYFGKNTEDLSLIESALLAGLPRAPSSYNPIHNKKAAIERRNIVLSLMKEQKYITDTELKQSEASPIQIVKAAAEDTANHYADFMDTVMSEATEMFGITEGQLLASGFQIFTTMDPKVQLAAEAVYLNDSLFPASKPDQLIQSSAVIIDQHNGEIRGIVGHRGEGVYRGFNYATKLKRQPGSSFKPLAVYGPALEQGYTPDSVLPDIPLNINGYQPQNYDRQTRGDVTLKEAIAQSYNIPAVWLLNELGIDSGMNFVTRTGITLTKEDRNLGIALGGLSEGSSPLQMAQSFTAFSNQGDIHPAHTIIRILSSSGELLVGNNDQVLNVTTPEVAYTMTTLLVNAVNQGTGAAAALDRPTAGKTGTTQLPDTAEFAGITGGSKDIWFVGYTPELTAAIWIGYDNTDKDHYLTSRSFVAASIFKQILSQALINQPIIPFPVPSSLASGKSNEIPSNANNNGQVKQGKNHGKGKHNKNN